jgi:hypothetical protein
MVDIEELTKSDLEPMIVSFDTKLEHLSEKAAGLLDKTKNQETNSEKLPEIEKQFEVIRERFQQGVYNEMIIGELNRNYKTIQDMFLKLKREEAEDATLNQTLASLEKNMDRTVFDYVRSVIDERNCLIDQYEKNLKN